MASTLADPGSPPRDAWLIPVLETLLTPEHVAALGIDRRVGLWEAAVARGGLTDMDILAAAATRLKLPVADLSRVSPRATHLVAERWARRYNVLPLAAT